MKPIKLSIKGLNSFKALQEIDFGKLTSQGLFGVFGPTGSGKSTILDGITLALYGKTSRNSSNFINTQSDSMQVNYEFKIKEQTYKITRTYKRNNQNKINATKPTRICEIVNQEEIILEESTTSVDKKCKEIIGLSFDDFVRTVVLPQGKFSEFLKIKGVERNEMLERLFSLGKYGDELSRKVVGARKIEKDKLNVLSGQLIGYEDVSEEKLINLKEQLINLENDFKNEEKTYKSTLESFKELEKLKGHIENLENQKKLMLILEDKKESVELKKNKVLIGEKILIVKPYLEAKVNTEKSVADKEENLIKIEKLLKEREVLSNENKILFKEISFVREVDIPKLKILEHKITESIKENEKLVIKKEESINLDLALDKNREKVKTLTIKKEENIDRESILLIKKEEINKQVESLSVNSTERGEIQEGYMLEKNLSEKSNEITKQKTKSEKYKEEVSDKKDQLKDINLKLEELKSDLEKVVSKKIELEESKPGDHNDIINLSKENDIIIRNNKERNDIQKELDDINIKTTIKTSEFEDALKVYKKSDDDFKITKESYENNLKSHYISVIKESLEKDKPCPVCGSLDHIDSSLEKIDLISSEIYEKEKNELDSLTFDLHVKESSINTLKESKLSLDSKLAEKAEYVIEEILTKKLDELKTGIDRWQTDYDLNEKYIADKTNNKLILEISKENHLKDIERLEKEHRELQEQLTETNESYLKNNKILNEMYLKYNTDNFNVQNIKNKKADEEVEKLRVELKDLESEYSNLKIQTDTMSAEITSLNNETIKTEQISIEIKNFIISSEEKLTENIGNRRDLKDYLNETYTKINDIESKYKKVESELKDSEDKYNESLKEKDTNFVLLEEFKNRMKKETKILEEMLSKENLDVETVSENNMSTEELSLIKKEITGYEEEYKELQIRIKDVDKLINKRTLTDEEFKSELSKMTELEEVLKNIGDQIVVIKKDIEYITNKLKEQTELLKEKDKIDRKLSILLDLDSLFKGRKFVEFVASYQLRYVSLEASKILSEITSGKYAIEVDEDGKFIIRDYSYGGVTRDASTLSGGETFLASLSLALALSSQIQLKGTAPLELFFLDEGFGTLDDDFLELVMSSLERVHNERLSIGLISHVESIKNRVPIKLLIKPAVPGISGSTVSIERT